MLLSTTINAEKNATPTTPNFKQEREDQCILANTNRAPASTETLVARIAGWTGILRNAALQAAHTHPSVFTREDGS